MMADKSEFAEEPPPPIVTGTLTINPSVVPDPEPGVCTIMISASVRDPLYVCNDGE